MKKLIALVLVLTLCATVLAACGDKEKKAEKPLTLVGTWEYSGMDCHYTFNDDGTGVYYFIGAEQKFTYTDNGDSVTIQFETSDFPSDHAYEIKGKTLLIEDSFGDMVEYTRAK